MNSEEYVSAIPERITVPDALDTPEPSLRVFRPDLRTPWKLSRARRRDIVNRVLEIVFTGTTGESLAAVRLILEMDRINLEQLKKFIEDSNTHSD